jgi:hypothetical protein
MMMKIVKHEYHNVDTGEKFEFTDFNQVKCEVNENDNTIKLWVPVEMLNRAHEVLTHCEHLFSQKEYNQLVDSGLQSVTFVIEVIFEFALYDLFDAMNDDEIDSNPVELDEPELVGYETFYLSKYVDNDGEHTFGSNGPEKGIFKKIEDEIDSLYEDSVIDGDFIDTEQHKLYVYLEEIESEE